MSSDQAPLHYNDEQSQIRPNGTFETFHNEDSRIQSNTIQNDYTPRDHVPKSSRISPLFDLRIWSGIIALEIFILTVISLYQLASNYTDIRTLNLSYDHAWHKSALYLGQLTIAIIFAILVLYHIFELYYISRLYPLLSSKNLSPNDNGRAVIAFVTAGIIILHLIPFIFTLSAYTDTFIITGRPIAHQVKKLTIANCILQVIYVIMQIVFGTQHCIWLGKSKKLQQIKDEQERTKNAVQMTSPNNTNTTTTNNNIDNTSYDDNTYNRNSTQIYEQPQPQLQPHPDI